MKFILLCILLDLFVANALSPAEQNLIVAFHNGLRRATKPVAANMKVLKYSVDLERTAEAWTGDVTGIARYNTIMSVDGLQPALDVWAAEALKYNYDKNTCDGQSASMCSNYTAMVRAVTEEVGCAVKDMPQGQKGKLVVCAYHPFGGSDQQPYVSGTPCSECPLVWSLACNQGLCAPWSGEGSDNYTDLPFLRGFAQGMAWDVDWSPAHTRLIVPQAHLEAIAWQVVGIRLGRWGALEALWTVLSQDIEPALKQLHKEALATSYKKIYTIDKVLHFVPLVTKKVPSLYDNFQELKLAYRQYQSLGAAAGEQMLNHFGLVFATLTKGLAENAYQC